MPEIKITETQRVKVEKGDILVVTVPKETPGRQVRMFRMQLHKDVTALGALAYVVAAEPGAIVFELVKQAQLTDIYARLEVLERETPHD